MIHLIPLDVIVVVIATLQIKLAPNVGLYRTINTTILLFTNSRQNSENYRAGDCSRREGRRDVEGLVS